MPDAAFGCKSRWRMQASDLDTWAEVQINGQLPVDVAVEPCCVLELEMK
jgi:hypothetical protein